MRFAAETRASPPSAGVRTCHLYNARSNRSIAENGFLTACCKILVSLKINDALIGEFGSTQHPAALVCVPSQHSPVRADAFPPTPPLPTVPDGPAAAGCTPRPTDRPPAGSSTGPRAALCATQD